MLKSYFICKVCGIELGRGVQRHRQYISYAVFNMTIAQKLQTALEWSSEDAQIFYVEKSYLNLLCIMVLIMLKEEIEIFF